MRTRTTRILLASTFCVTAVMSAYMMCKTPRNDHVKASLPPVTMTLQRSDVTVVSEASVSVPPRPVTDLPAQTPLQRGQVDSAQRSQHIGQNQPAAIFDENPSDAVRVLSNQAAGHLRTMLEDAERFPALKACQAAGSNCQELQSKALASVLAWPIQEHLFNDVYGLGELEEVYGVELVQELLHEQVEEAYARASSPEERLIALAWLTSRTSAEARPLSAAVYADLEDRPDPEINLLLAYYERAPVNDTRVVEAIWHLATETAASTAVRLRAIRSLGFAETADKFGEAVEFLDIDGLLTREIALSDVVPSLSRCGVACVSEFGRLASSENAAARLTAMSAVTRLEPSTRKRVLDQIKPVLLANPTLSYEERDQLAYLAHLSEQ